MASKLQKMQGIPRIAEHDMQWKGFHVRKGYAFGMDEQGRMFVSPCMRSENGSMFVWFAVDDKPVKCSYLEETQGHFSMLVGRRPMIREAGFYATEWALRWKPSAIAYDSILARRIVAAKKQAAPCERNPYRGLTRLHANAM